MMAFILATDFDFIVYMSKMAFFWKLFFTPMAFLEYDFNDIFCVLCDILHYCKETYRHK